MPHALSRYPSPALALAAILVVAHAPVLRATTQETDTMRRRIEQMRRDGRVELGSARIAAVAVLPEVYERRAFRLAWNRSTMLEQLITEIRGADRHGLLPSDYHLEELSRRLAAGEPRSADPATLVALDLLLSDALARLAFTIHFGKLNPEALDPVWNFSRELDGDDAVRVFGEVLESGDISGFLAEIAPPGFIYDGLRDGLARYQAIADSGGWPTIPGGPVLKPDVTDPRVAVLRERLRITGDLEAPGPVDPKEYDATIEQAVMHFQQRHGIDPDGKVGPRTLAELNEPVAARVDQLRASLERTRWVFRDLEEEFLLVDIAGFKLHYVRNFTQDWTTRVQVGKPYHQTPVFKSQMRYLVFNPGWTVPPGILKRDVLPAIRKDPEYLTRQNMVVLGSGGSPVDPATVDWNVERFPYTIRQDPGPHNALGVVKFVFPNDYFVYLHDTPSRALFSRAERAFSSGCIRVEDPLELAEMLLEDTPGWDRATIERTVASGTTSTVFLAEPVTVMLLYWTAGVEPDGTITFSNDVYDRDPAVIDGLKEPFEFTPPRGLPRELRGR
jgi:murein L,D-transpeptidase YcbB/YkuD